MSRSPSNPGGPDGAPGFQALTLHAAQALSDLDALDALLASKDDLDEARDVLPFFRAHPQLALFGLFRADLVGDWQRKRYCFVEFEDARAESIFKATARRTSDWATRFQKGYCQVVDWFWLLEAQQDTVQFEAQFGKRTIQATGLLVIGRDRTITAGDRHRFEGWRDRVIVDSRTIICCTYDELARDLRDRLTFARDSGGRS